MTPEKEAEVLSKIDLLIELVRHQSARTDSIEARLTALAEHVGEVAEDVAEIKGRLFNLPQPPEFYELRGRVEEISRRLPTAIAYAPPTRETSR